MLTEAVWCPNGAARAPESVVLGVRSGVDGQVTYLADPVPASAVLDQVPTDIEPHRLLRFASHCSAACTHHSPDHCTLAERTVATPTPAAPAAAPHCHLRVDCRWWRQTGLAACVRCPALTEGLAGR